MPYYPDGEALVRVLHDAAHANDFEVGKIVGQLVSDLREARAEAFGRLITESGLRVANKQYAEAHELLEARIRHAESIFKQIETSIGYYRAHPDLG